MLDICGFPQRRGLCPWPTVAGVPPAANVSESYAQRYRRKRYNAPHKVSHILCLAPCFGILGLFGPALQISWRVCTLGCKTRTGWAPLASSNSPISADACPLQILILSCFTLISLRPSTAAVLHDICSTYRLRRTHPPSAKL